MKKTAIFIPIVTTILYVALIEIVPYLMLHIDLFDYNSDPKLRRWSPSLLIALSSLLILSLVYFYSRFNKCSYLKKESSSKYRYIFIAVILGFGMILIQYPIYFFSDFINNTNKQSAINSEQLKFELWLLPAIISRTLIAPVSEELLFRKIIFSNLTTTYKVNYAIIISSLLFGAIHLPNIEQSLIAIIGGVISALIFHETSKLIYSIIFHITWNSIVIFSMYSSIL